MKEFKILAVLIVLVGITYYGIEPYAHHIMHPEAPAPDYAFNDLKNVDTSIAADANKGKELFTQNCAACHGLSADDIPAPMSNADSAASYGVVPPDLSLAGRIYQKNFLANVIFDPVKAMDLEHKYSPESGKAFPMPAYNWMPPQDIMDIVAYLESVAPKYLDKQALEKVATEENKGKEFNMAEAVHKLQVKQDKELFEAACGRCHSMAYAGLEAHTPGDTIKGYMGSTPPDLSMYIRSRGEDYLKHFINNPQGSLHGTAMPRVGLTKAAEDEIVTFMESVGDSKKEERNSLGIYVIIYFIIFTIFAYLWKRKIWEEVH